jgi:hypothetical protein
MNDYPFLMPFVSCVGTLICVRKAQLARFAN